MFGEKLVWIIGVGTAYSWFCLSYFVLLLPCVTHSSCLLPTCLCWSEKRNELRLFCGAQVFFLHSSSQAWLAPHGRFLLASVWPKHAEKLRLFCRSRLLQWNEGFMVSSFLSFFISKRITKLKLLTTLHWTIVVFFLSCISIYLLCYVCLSIPWS